MALIVRLVPGTPRTGLWCPKCLLPSGIEVQLHTLWDSGVGTLGVVRRCYHCGAPLPPDGER